MILRQIFWEKNGGLELLTWNKPTSGGSRLELVNQDWSPTAQRHHNRTIASNFWNHKWNAKRAGIYTFWIPGDFLTYMYAYWSINQEHFSRMCIRTCYKVNSCEKREVHVSNSKSMVLRVFTHVYVYWVRNSEPFALGPVRFRWPRGAAENWFTKPWFWEHFVSLS